MRETELFSHASVCRNDVFEKGSVVPVDEALLLVKVHRFSKLGHDLEFTHDEGVQAAANLDELPPDIKSFVHLKRVFCEAMDVGQVGRQRFGMDVKTNIENPIARREFKNFFAGLVGHVTDEVDATLFRKALGSDGFGDVNVFR